MSTSNIRPKKYNSLINDDNINNGSGFTNQRNITNQIKNINANISDFTIELKL